MQLILLFLFVFIIVFSSITKLSTLWLNEKISAYIGNDITSQAFSIALRQPYSFQINRNSSSIIATMIRYSDDYVNSVKMILKFFYYGFWYINIDWSFSINFKVTSFAIIGFLSFTFNHFNF